MAGRLWDYFDGEPFLDNPRLGILGLNPRGKVKGKKMAAHRNSRGQFVKARRNSSKRKTTRARRNPWPVGGMVVAPNPRRRKTSRRRRNPSVLQLSNRRRRTMRRNPAFLGLSIPPIKSILFAGVGFIAPPIVEGLVSRYVPASITGNKVGALAVRLVSVVGLTYLVKQFVGAEEAKMTAIGGGVYVLTASLKDFAPGMIPGLAAYVPMTNPRSLAAYVPSASVGSGGTGGLGVPTAALFGGNSGSVGGTAARFRKY